PALHPDEHASEDERDDGRAEDAARRETNHAEKPAAADAARESEIDVCLQPVPPLLHDHPGHQPCQQPGEDPSDEYGEAHDSLSFIRSVIGVRSAPAMPVASSPNVRPRSCSPTAPSLRPPPRRWWESRREIPPRSRPRSP